MESPKSSQACFMVEIKWVNKVNRNIQVNKSGSHLENKDVF